MNQVFFNQDKTVINYVSFGKTKNKKIAYKNEKICQTYHFSIEQFKFIISGGKGINLNDGFLQSNLTQNNCGVCPLRFGGCYTFKYEQAMGNLKIIRSVGEKYKNLDNIPIFNNDIKTTILNYIKKKNIQYIRFGSYGCPTNLDINLVKNMSESVKIWTGYTHEWHNINKVEYLKYFMASAHKDKSLFSAKLANEYGFRTFETDSNNGIQCLYEAKDIKCSKCGLCSGTSGKGKVNIFTKTH